MKYCFIGDCFVTLAMTVECVIMRTLGRSNLFEGSNYYHEIASLLRNDITIVRLVVF